MSESQAGFTGSTPTRWAKQCVVSLGVLICLLMAYGGIASLLVDANGSALFFTGLYFNVVVWVSGVLATLAITHSSDASLWYLTPLTPRRYYTKNLERVALLFLTVYVAVPDALIACAVMTMKFSDTPVPILSRHFLVNAALLYYLALAVPLSEAMTGKRNLTALVFVLRHPLRWLSWTGPLILIVLVFTKGWWTPLVEAPIRRVLDALMGAGVPGQAIILILSPMSAIAAAVNAPENAAMSWFITAFLLLMLAWSIRGIYGAMRRTAPDIELEQVQYWSDHKEELEEAEEEAMLEGERQDEGSVVAFASLEKDSGLGNEAPDPLHYESAHSPERQVLRHKRHWLKPRARTAALRHRAVAFVMVHLWWIVVCACWVLWLNSAGSDSTRLLLFMGLFWMAFLSCAASAFRLCQGAGTGIGLPLRWPKLIVMDYASSLRRNALADFLAALLLTEVAGSGAADTFLLFVYILVTRLYWYVFLWLLSLRYNGRKWIARANLLVLLSALLAKFVVLTAAAEERAQMDAGPAVSPELLALLSVIAGLLGLACLSLLFALRKSGTDVLGWPQQVKSPLEEPL